MQVKNSNNTIQIVTDGIPDFISYLKKMQEENPDKYIAFVWSKFSNSTHASNMDRG
ncbi:hypothetical protein [Maribacter sp.]|uniref:hypothetical protein n=1 Tax=Maribacter sp. TaxID=1897614 RepID=UPI0025BAB996|nr:hypothetical protein [Maribacter sp.]